MKASAFSYARANSVDDALALLAAHGDAAKTLAGGQSLMPALNLRLSAPELIIDIGHIASLKGIDVSDGALTIGALTRHSEMLTSPDIKAHAPLLADAIAHVAHPAIRNRGTIGGNLAHADPASELPACMMALKATIVVQGPEGKRRIAATSFFTGIYETVLRPDELLVAVELPAASHGATHYFHEHARRKGDYAIVGLAASAVIDGDRFSDLRLGFFAIGDRPISARAAKHLIGKPITASALAEANAALDAELDPQDDQQASPAMRRHLARQLMADCVATLLGRDDLQMRMTA